MGCGIACFGSWVYKPLNLEHLGSGFYSQGPLIAAQGTLNGSYSRSLALLFGVPCANPVTRVSDKRGWRVDLIKQTYSSLPPSLFCDCGNRNVLRGYLRSHVALMFEVPLGQSPGPKWSSLGG